MDEYIKRDDAILRMCACFRFTQQMSRKILEAVPTADVVPRELYQRALSDVVTLSAERKRGVWLTGLAKDSDGSVRRTFSFCSVCNLLVEKETNYCPNCGAKMGIE